MNNKLKSHQEKIKQQAFINPSYDKSLSAGKRMRDFLGAYHIILHGVRTHDPFYLDAEGKPEERCDTDDKDRFVEFVERLVSDALSEHDQLLIDLLEEEKVDRMQTLHDTGWNSALSRAQEIIRGGKE